MNRTTADRLTANRWTANRPAANRPAAQSIPNRLQTGRAARLGKILLLLGLLGIALPPAAAQAQTPALPLSAYPRPANDTGWGVHWAPVLVEQPPAVVDRYVAEADELGLRWLKLMQPDQPTLSHAYLLQQLRARGIEPVLRVQKTFNDPYANLDALVTAGVQAGVDYYELYTNPNVAGLAGGWRSGQAIDPELLATRWIDAARRVRAAGGYPALPSLSPNGSIDDETFLRRFLRAVQRDGADALIGAWLPVQNYMGNLPLDDPSGFRRFERYHTILQEETGLTLPILSTEGGALVGDQQDPQRPALTDELVAQRTRQAFQALTNRPDYYFAFMPWLLLNEAGGGYSSAWEAHAWFPAEGDPQPVVQALKSLGSGAPAAPAAPAAQPKPIDPPSALLQFAGTPAAQTPAPQPPEAATAPSPAEEASAAPAPAQPVIEQARVLVTGAVTVQEGSITLDTYDYESALRETGPGDPIFPAPRLRHDAVGGPAPRAYRAIFLENDFLRLTILPELGGRIYRWEDKENGWDVLYHNPVVKPTKWGVRGWWLALGGMEWTFPLPDHGLNEFKPWEVEIITDGGASGQGAAAVRLGRNGPDGLRVAVKIALNGRQRFFAVTTELSNRGQQPLTTHYWSNAMLAPGPENRVPADARLVWPANGAQIHGNAHGGDDSRFDWPGKADYRSLQNWPESFSFFAAPAAQRSGVGLVLPEGEVAVVRSFPHRAAPGLKTFYGPGLDPSLWTDDGSGPYFELWGGPSTDFRTPVRLETGQTKRWTEQWYTVPGLGAFVAANAHAALALHPRAGETELRLAATGPDVAQDARLIVRVDGRILLSEAVSLAVGELYRVGLPVEMAGRRWLVQLFDREGTVLLAYDSRPDPQPAPKPPVQPLPVRQPVKPPVWDERLDDLGIEIIPARVQPGQAYWRVIEAEFQTPREGGGRHHIFLEVLDESGERILGKEVEVLWQDGSARVTTEDKPAPEYAANFPMYGNLGGYRVRIPDGPSDVVTGMGLPYGRTHVVYNITYQRTIK